MNTYRSFEEAEYDPDLDLKIVWVCDKCGDRREERPGYNEGGPCKTGCGGEYQESGESYQI